jgi:CO/xanthine dehydrogenase FAD-binding subunit
MDTHEPRPAAYLRPTQLGEALAALASADLTVLAGGTDYYPARLARTKDDDVLDVSAIPELRGIRIAPDGVVLGATTTWTEVAEAALPPAFRALQQAGRQVGALQIQNTGTVAGNVCNASPAADGVPPMLALGAEVVLRSVRGERRLPLGEFIRGNRRTARARDELLTAIRFPAFGPRARSSFAKLGARAYLVISIAMVAAVLDVDETGTIRWAAVAVGACSPVALRLPALERKLLGRRPGPELPALAAPEDLDVLSPIDDVRASAAYRREAALTLVRRALEEAAS